MLTLTSHRSATNAKQPRHAAAARGADGGGARNPGGGRRHPVPGPPADRDPRPAPYVGGPAGRPARGPPSSELLISVPGIGVRTAATILALSATAARSPPPTASPPMPGWRRSPSPPAAPFAAIPSKARYMSGITATPDECSSP